MRRTVRLAAIAILRATGGTVLPACGGSSETGEIAGKESMDSALRNCQNIASRVR
jgi:hypothetical protein